MSTDDTDWYLEGYFDGETSVRSRSGTRGAGWNAKMKDLEGADREDYIQGFNAALDEYIEETENED